MSLYDTIIHANGETVAYLAGCIVGGPLISNRGAPDVRASASCCR